MNKRKSWACYLVTTFTLIAFPLICWAQYFTIDTIKGKSPFGQHQRYIFPHLKSKHNAAAAQAINQALALEILEVDSGEIHKSIFENIWGDEDELPAISNISWQVINNDSSFFSISIFATANGTYHEQPANNYTWESTHGTEIELGQLFTETGLQNLRDIIYTQRYNLLKSNIAMLNDSVKHETYEDSITDIHGFHSALNTYAECLDTVGINYSDAPFTLSKKQLTVYLQPCFPEGKSDLKKSDIPFIIDAKLLTPGLSDFGKLLLR